MKWFLFTEKVKYLIPYWIRQWYWNIRAFIKPRHRWLTSKIPFTWRDKDTIFEICIIEGIKHFVEGEKALQYYDNVMNDPEYPDHQKKFDTELKNVYELVTKKLPLLEKQLKDEWDKIEPIDFSTDGFKSLNKPRPSYEEKYGRVDKLEKEISDLKTDVMVWAVTYRESMWT